MTFPSVTPQVTFYCPHGTAYGSYCWSCQNFGGWQPVQPSAWSPVPGWQCPACKRVYSPLVGMCWFCPQPEQDSGEPAKSDA